MSQSVSTMANEVVHNFAKDEVMTKAAALALYCVLGLAPIVLLVLAATTWMGPKTENAVTGQIDSLVGGEAAEGVAQVMKSAKEKQDKEQSGTWAGVIGLITLLVSASGVFAQLQSSLNDIWGVQPKANAGVWGWLRARLLSIGILLSVLFLLLVSLVVTAGIVLVFGREGALWNLLTLAVSFAVYVLLFALIFKYLPDAKMRWRDVWVGAALTAALFAIGKHFIGLYLGHSALASSYGAAGSLVALIVWAYYSAIIVFLGAEATQVYTRHFGAGILPDEYAEFKGNHAAA